MRKTFVRVLSIVGVAGAIGVAGAGTALASPFRYYDSYDGPNPWYTCAQVGNQGIADGRWWDADCRPGYRDGVVDLYIQVRPD